MKKLFDVKRTPYDMNVAAAVGNCGGAGCGSGCGGGSTKAVIIGAISNR